MTAPAMSNEQSRPGADSTAYLRRRGRDFIISLYGTLRAIKLYPVEHTAVQRSLTELAGIAAEIVAREKSWNFVSRVSFFHQLDPASTGPLRTMRASGIC